MFQMMTQTHALSITTLLSIGDYAGVAVRGNTLRGHKFRISFERSTEIDDAYEARMSSDDVTAIMPMAANEPLSLPEIVPVLMAFLNRYAGNIVDTDFYR